MQGALLLAGDGVHALYDIADPFRPVRLAGFESPHHEGEAESHQTAFLRDTDGTVYAVMISGRGIDVFDLTDVTSPFLVSALELEGIDYGDNTEAVWGWPGRAPPSTQAAPTRACTSSMPRARARSPWCGACRRRSSAAWTRARSSRSGACWW
ncbi:MAG: hypothetical protein M5U28_01455 [Sandaracinaceae bacterium]|nr:hypothetical protein [Sandaracinaceae bacterium]